MPASLTSPDYSLGFQHGFEAAQSGVVPMAAAPTTRQWALATGTLLAGFGAAGILVARVAAPKTGFELFVLATASGLLITTLIASVKVLDGQPTPKLGLT